MSSTGIVSTRLVFAHSLPISSEPLHRVVFLIRGTGQCVCNSEARWRDRSLEADFFTGFLFSAQSA
jgi:hypothetical protein